MRSSMSYIHRQKRYYCKIRIWVYRFLLTYRGSNCREWHVCDETRGATMSPMCLTSLVSLTISDESGLALFSDPRHNFISALMNNDVGKRCSLEAFSDFNRDRARERDRYSRPTSITGPRFRLLRYTYIVDESLERGNVARNNRRVKKEIRTGRFSRSREQNVMSGA